MTSKITQIIIISFSLILGSAHAADEATIGGSLLLTPYGGSVGPSVSGRWGSGIFRGGVSGNLGALVGPFAVGVLATVQPDLYVGPKALSLHLAAMGAFVGVMQGGVGTLIAVAGLESEISDRVRIHADVYVPPFIVRTKDLKRFIFPTLGARIFGPKKKMFVDAQLVITQFSALPVIPTLTIGTRF